MSLLWSVFYVLFCGVLAHVVGEAIPRSWFCADRFPYTSWRWEKGGMIYEQIGIRRWKDRIPDMSRVVKRMVPKRFDRFPTAKDVERLIAETCVAEATHTVLCLLAPVIWAFWQNVIGVLLTAAVVLGNLLFILVQRYNRPTLVALHERLVTREERRRNASTDFIR